MSDTLVWACSSSRKEGVVSSYAYAPDCMSLTVAPIVNSALSFVSGACRTYRGYLIAVVFPRLRPRAEHSFTDVFRGRGLSAMAAAAK
jgi:hypothetical protein